MNKVLDYLLGGSVMTGIFALITYGLGWLRYKKTDQAKADKVRAETAIDLAAVNSKRIEDEIKLADVALKWTAEFADSLKEANILLEKKQAENDALRIAIEQMKNEFYKRVREMENDFEKRKRDMDEILEMNRKELEEEREKNTELIAQLNNFFDNGGKK